MAKLSSWGNYPLIEAKEFYTHEFEPLSDYIQSTETFIPRGNGRSYGDSALNGKVASMLGFNRILNFDVVRGELTAEAGVLFSDLLEVLVPKGFFLPVTPGTKFITLGGAIASNVHGKNHHKEGAFSNFVLELGLMTAQGQYIICSPTNHSDIFRQTIGGMGLTGVILWVRFRLKKIQSSYIKQVNHKAKNLGELLSLFESCNSSTYSVAWIDCQKGGKDLGRSILILGEHADLDELETTDQRNFPLKSHSNKHVSVPFHFPSGMLNRWTVSIFNHLYFHKEFQNSRSFLAHYDPFFYPLDKILHWNRIYGKKGFLQYQFVIPFEAGAEGLELILQKISASGFASFLAVLKTFGPSTSLESDISFPQKGYTLALDFPVSSGIFELLDELDQLVLNFGGRVYLTKDARMSPETFQKMYPLGFPTQPKFSSLQSQRLKLHI